MHPEIKPLIDSLKSGLFCVLSKDLEKLKGKIMSATIADLDAVIAALPGQIETALQPVIAAIEAKSAGTVDLSAEIASLNAIPAAVAAAVTPAPAAPAAESAN